MDWLLGGERRGTAGAHPIQALLQRKAMMYDYNIRASGPHEKWHQVCIESPRCLHAKEDRRRE
jgi:hypothetical protein